jgi:hypothetical protein
MAKFQLELPTEIMKDFQKVYDNADEIFGEMTKAGAEVVEKNIISNVPESIRNSKMMRCLKLTKVYKTPSDDGINTKVGFYGYFQNENGKTVPAPLVANVFEYGRSNLPFPKHPFLRKSFKKSEIESAMLKAQKKASGGLLDE